MGVSYQTNSNGTVTVYNNGVAVGTVTPSASAAASLGISSSGSSSSSSSSSSTSSTSSSSGSSNTSSTTSSTPQSSSAEYKGHTITFTISGSGTSWSGKISCSGPYYSNSNSVTGTSATDVGNKLNTYSNQYKSAIDSAISSGQAGNSNSSSDSGSSSYNPKNYYGEWTFDGHSITVQGKSGGATLTCSGPLYNKTISISASNDSQLESGIESALKGVYGQIVKLEMNRDHGASITWGTLNNGNRAGYGMGDDGKIWLCWFTTDTGDNSSWTSRWCDPGIGYDTAIEKGFSPSFAEGIKSLDGNSSNGNNSNLDNNNDSNMASTYPITHMNTTTSYKGHSLTVRIIQTAENSYSCAAICNDVGISATTTKTTLTAASDWCASKISLIKSAIDNLDNNGSSNNNSNTGGDPTEQRILHDSITYNGYTIRRGIASYGTSPNLHYEINCNCQEVGYDAPVQTATTESQARQILNNMVNEAKAKIDAANNNNNNNNSGGDPTEQWIIHDSITYNGYTIRRGIASYGTSPNLHYEINCNCQEVGYDAPVQTATTESQARQILNNMVNQAKAKIDAATNNNQEPIDEEESTDNSAVIVVGPTTYTENGHTATGKIIRYGDPVNGKYGYDVDLDCDDLNIHIIYPMVGTQAQAEAKLAELVNNFKAKANGQQDTENPENPENPDDGEGTEIIRENYVVNGKTATIVVREYPGTNGRNGYDIWVKSNDPAFSQTRSVTGDYTAALNELKNLFAQAAGGQPQEDTNTQFSGDYVRGDAATARGGNYQQQRNQSAANDIYNQMKDKSYATGSQAQKDFWQKLMALVNSTGGNLQITADGEILGENATQRRNTVKIIENMILTKAGVANWDQFANLTGGGSDNGNNGGNNNGGNNGSTGGNNTGTSGFTTGSGAADNTWNSLQGDTGDLYAWLNKWYTDSMNGWNTRKDDVGDYGAAIADRINGLNNSFNNAAAHLNAASDLQKKAQRIYSDQNIQKMNQQLRQMGFEAGKAAPAVYYQVTKQMANTAIELAKLQSEEEKTLAELETQRAQLEDEIKAAGIEADQWTVNMLNEIEKQIQSIRDNYNTQKSNILGTWTLQPKLDVMSNQLQADLENMAQMYQSQFVENNPSQMLLAAANIFGSDWVYCDASTAMSYSSAGNFANYLAKCAESIRNNKIKAETQIATAGSTKYYDSGTTTTTTTTPVYAY